MHLKHKKHHTYFFLLLAFSILLTCNEAKKVRSSGLKARAENDWNSSIPGNFIAQTALTFDSLEINGFLKRYPELKAHEENIRTFYRHRNFSFAWFDKDGLIEQAGNLTDRVMNLRNEGLNKTIPYYQSLDSLMYGENVNQQSRNTKITLELMLTAQYFAFANIAWEGMDASVSKAANWYLPRKKVSYEEYLDSILDEDQDGLQTSRLPVYRQYELLRSYLIRYRELNEKSNGLIIRSEAKVFKRGDSSAIISQVRQKLFELGDLNNNRGDDRFDLILEEAVKQFQFRHGLKNDGILGRSTFDELNVPYEARIRQLIVNMERSRWLPVSLNSDYLVVNIPEFNLHVYHSDSLLWSCNVVVGQTVHKTVVFSGELSYVVFSPYWNVPSSIVRNEILPAMRNDPNYLSRHHMEIIGYRDGLPDIRQKPGADNALGLVKFLFPNSYSIYMHDTPSKSLFGESSRAFSHGCIRVSEPFKLAKFLFRNDPAWNDEKIRAAMNASRERLVVLDQKVPVFIAYFTAFVDRNGHINFRKDIYDRDCRLAEMMLN